MPVALEVPKLLRLAVAGCAALFLSGCLSDGGSSSRPAAAALSAPVGAVSSEPLDAPAGGQAKAALILPLSASGNAGATARSMKNAGEMALAEFNNPGLQLIVKDDGGSAQGAAAAAQQAIGEGAQVILGPLFAQSVASVGQVARQSNVPVLAFSTDASVATSGVYLLSFLPQTDVERIVSYAVKNGKRSFAALLPDDAYGSVVEGALQEAVAHNGGRLVALERYPANQSQMQAAVQRVAQAARGADAIFIPDQAPALATALASAGVDLKRVAVLGTGIWDDPDTLNAPQLAGGLYAGPESTGWAAFSQRYKARYGEAPVRTATLAYDAVLLAAALTQARGPEAFSQQTLTSASGFQGIDGIFRLKPDGLNERGLAVLRVQPGGAQVVSPAPKSFAGMTAGL